MKPQGICHCLLPFGAGHKKHWEMLCFPSRWDLVSLLLKFLVLPYLSFLYSPVSCMRFEHFLSRDEFKKHNHTSVHYFTFNHALLGSIPSASGCRALGRMAAPLLCAGGGTWEGPQGALTTEIWEKTKRAVLYWLNNRQKTRWALEELSHAPSY